MPTGYELDAMRAAVRIATALNNIDATLTRIADALDQAGDKPRAKRTERLRPAESDSNLPPAGKSPP